MKNKLNYDYLIIENGMKYYGGNQEWYKTFPKRMAGCGPTTASNITMYELRKQGIKESYNIEEFLELMNTLWEYVTPGVRGVNSVEMFKIGYDKYLKASKLNLPQNKIMNIPLDKSLRPSNIEVFKFLNKAIENNHPIAFLNLDNGEEKRLESWHWVTIIEIEYNEEYDKLNVTIADNGSLKNLDLGLWVTTTRREGGFLYYI